MKKILLFMAIVFLLIACSGDDNSEPTYLEVLPVDHCQMPYAFYHGETYHIKVYYKLPSGCHIYKGIYYEKNGNTRIVAIQSFAVSRDNCEPVSYEDVAEDELPHAEFDFQATGSDPYTFKFWTGRNDAGEDTYYEVEIPVED